MYDSEINIAGYEGRRCSMYFACKPSVGTKQVFSVSIPRYSSDAYKQSSVVDAFANVNASYDGVGIFAVKRDEALKL